ncbi:hypothetical protein M569_08192, partial [Genlisea aurea]
IILEADCVTLVSVITEDSMMNGTLCNILCDIKVILQDFDNSTAVFVRREANKSA